MAKSPRERREQRDAYARAQINPDTGKPFKNYNALDTYQRNQRAKVKGYSSRGQQRYTAQKTRAVTITSSMPRAFDIYLAGREPTVSLRNEFERAFGKGSGTPSRMRKRQDYLDSEYGDDWNWRLWRVEYSAA